METLISLVHSLSGPEKRYVKKYVQMHKDNGYTAELFETVCRKSVLEKGRFTFKGKPGVKQEQLHVIKYQLRDTILKALQHFHQKDSIQSLHLADMQYLPILYDKEQYDLGFKILKRAEERAFKNEMFQGLVEIFEWKRKFVQAQNPSEFNAIISIVEEQRKVIETVSAENYHWQKALEVSSIFFNRASFDANKILSQLGKAPSLQANVLQHFILMQVELMRSDQAKAISTMKQLVKEFENNKVLLSKDPGMYMSTVNNLAGLVLMSGDFKGALELIHHSREIYRIELSKHKSRRYMKSLLRSYNVELEILRDGHNYSLAIPVIEEIASFIHDRKTHVPVSYFISFSFQIAYILFKTGQLKEALQWINGILTFSDRKVRIDLQAMARILNLMIHFERQNHFVLRYFVDNTRRFFNKYRKPLPAERELMSFFAKAGLLTPEQRNEHLSKLKGRYESLQIQQPQNHLFGYLDIMHWIDSRLAA